MLENSSTIIIQHNLGMFADLAALQAKYPSGRPGDYAGLHSDGNMYYWNGAAWTDTGISYTSLVGDSLTFDNTDPSTLVNPPAGKTWLGNYNDSLWTKDENGVVSWYATLTQLRQATAKSPAYWFDGVDDYINLGRQTYEANTFLFSVKIKDISSVYSLIDHMNYLSTGYRIYINSNKKIRITYYNPTAEDFESTILVKENTINNIGISFDQSTIKIVINNESETITTTAGGFDFLQDRNCLIGYGSGIPLFKGEAFYIKRLNKTSTASEMKEYLLNPENIPYELEGASNVIYTQSHDFSSTSGWSIGGTASINTTNEDATLTADGTALNAIGQINLWNVNEKDGKNITLIYKVKSSSINGDLRIGGWSAAEIFEAQIINKTVGIHNISKIPDRGGDQNRIYFYLDANNTTGSIVFDYIIVMQGGEVAAFHHSGIGHNTWKGKYGLSAIVNGAKPFNLPAHHIEAEIIETTSTSPSITPPEGYSVESISIITDENLTAIAAQQSGSLDNLITGKTLDGSVSQASKTYKQIGDHEIFDGTKTINFTLTGNGANGTKIIGNYKREE